MPKSPLDAAIVYALRNWVALTRYTADGRLKIDNNGAEQALRPIVLGRKNWLLAGSEAAAHRTAILCSLVQTCASFRSDRIFSRDKGASAAHALSSTDLSRGVAQHGLRTC